MYDKLRLFKEYWLVILVVTVVVFGAPIITFVAEMIT